MTIQRMRLPSTVGLLLIGLAWVIRDWPEPVVTVIRLSNGFIIVSLAMWLVQRVLSYERLLLSHRAEIMQLISRGEERRNEALAALMKQTSEIAADLAEKTARKAEAAEHASSARHEAITRKLDTVLGQQNESKDK